VKAKLTPRLQSQLPSEHVEGQLSPPLRNHLHPLHPKLFWPLHLVLAGPHGSALLALAGPHQHLQTALFLLPKERTA